MTINELEFPRENEELAEQIFDRMQPVLAALPSEKLLNLRLNVVTVVATVLGCANRIRTLRPRIAQELPAFDLSYLDNLENGAWLLRHTHTLYLACSRPPSCEPEVVLEATTLRQQLLNDANAMAERRIVDKSRLRNVSCLNGYRNLATDLAILASVLKNCWPAIQGKCAVTKDDLSRAEKLSEEFVRVAGRRDKRATSITKAMLDRRRAYTLLYTAYDEVRRCIFYLRWHEEDAELFAPSLFAGRSKGHSKKGSKNVAEAVPPAPAAAGTAAESVAVETAEPANDADKTPATGR